MTNGKLSSTTSRNDTGRQYFPTDTRPIDIDSGRIDMLVDFLCTGVERHQLRCFLPLDPSRKLLYIEIGWARDNEFQAVAKEWIIGDLLPRSL